MPAARQAWRSSSKASAVSAMMAVRQPRSRRTGQARHPLVHEDQVVGAGQGGGDRLLAAGDPVHRTAGALEQ